MTKEPNPNQIASSNGQIPKKEPIGKGNPAFYSLGIGHRDLIG
jgi:hypothetical protein